MAACSRKMARSTVSRFTLAAFAKKSAICLRAGASCTQEWCAPSCCCSTTRSGGNPDGSPDPQYRAWEAGAEAAARRNAACCWGSPGFPSSPGCSHLACTEFISHCPGFCLRTLCLLRQVRQIECPAAEVVRMSALSASSIEWQHCVFLSSHTISYVLAVDPNFCHILTSACDEHHPAYRRQGSLEGPACRRSCCP